MGFVCVLAVGAVLGWPRACLASNCVVGSACAYRRSGNSLVQVKKDVDEQDAVAQEEDQMATMGRVDEIDKVVFDYQVKKDVDEEDAVAQEEDQMATMGRVDEIDKVVFDFKELGKKTGCGIFSIKKNYKSGFSKEESSSKTFSMEAEAAAEYSSAFASASMSMKMGVSTASSMTAVNFQSSEDDFSFESRNDCNPWYAYQTEQTIHYKGGKTLTFLGSVWTTNATVQPITIHSHGAALARSWRINRPGNYGMQYVVTEKFNGGTQAHNMAYWGWREDDASFYVFTKKDSQPGLEAVRGYWHTYWQVFQFESWPLRSRMPGWGWKDEGIAFYAWPLDKAPVDALEVLEWRKGNMRFYCLRSWRGFHNLGSLGYKFIRVAFKVPAAPF